MGHKWPKCNCCEMTSGGGRIAFIESQLIGGARVAPDNQRRRKEKRKVLQ